MSQCGIGTFPYAYVILLGLYSNCSMLNSLILYHKTIVTLLIVLFLYFTHYFFINSKTKKFGNKIKMPRLNLKNQMRNIT